MKRNFLHAIIVLLCLITSCAYAAEASFAKVISHKEWVTGNIKLEYTLSNPKQDIIDSLVNKFRPSKTDDNLKELVHFGSVINSVDTEYGDVFNKTKIISHFFGEFRGFGYEQFFTINRELCIDPRKDEGSPSTCVHTESQILVDDEILILDIKSINLDTYNLKPGEYLVTTNMVVTKWGETIGYKTGDTSMVFTVKAH